MLGVPNVRDLDPAPGLTLARTLRDVDLDTLAALLPAGDVPERTPPSTARRADRRPLVIGGLVAATAALVGVAVLAGGSGDEGPPPLPPGAVAVDAWAPYWTLDDARPTLEARLDGLREVSPFFYVATGVGTIGLDPNASADDVDAFIDAARDSDARLVPSILDRMPAGGMAAILADPATREQHVQAILEFADDLDADGIDIDYEQFAFADGSATWETTRPSWVAFITELAGALHDDGRTLTVSVPAVYDAAATGDRGYWVYDHGAIAEHVDALRIMAYDFSTSEPGPIAPIVWVQQAIDGVSLAVAEEHRSKLVLGVPAYGGNWVASTSGTCPATAEGKTTVTARTVLDLATRRGGTPVYDPVTAEWSFSYSLEVSDATTACTQSRVVQWVDAEGIAARVELARRAGWGGVSLWALGYDDDADFTALIDAARRSIAATAPTTVG